VRTDSFDMTTTVSSQLDSDVVLAVEVLEAVDREIENLFIVTRNVDPAKAAFFITELIEKSVLGERRRARFVAATQLVQRRPEQPPPELQQGDRESNE
jgi:hypothetical protein